MYLKYLSIDKELYFLSLLITKLSRICQLLSFLRRKVLSTASKVLLLVDGFLPKSTGFLSFLLISYIQNLVIKGLLLFKLCRPKNRNIRTYAHTHTHTHRHQCENSKFVF